MDNFFHRLDEEEAIAWKRIHQGPFWRHLRANGIDRALYIAFMTEVYHYTKHNAHNQALAAVRVDSSRLSLLKYCLHHAYEEAGHDLMALRDLAAIGADPAEIRRSRPLPETEAFIAYLYRIASERDATARLGYSYWAEGCYEYIADLTTAIRRDLRLSDGQMTFLVEHSVIDKAHSEQVRKILLEACADPALQEGVIDVLRTSLHLMGTLFDASYERYKASLDEQR